MSPDLSPEAWAQLRYDYEHTERPIEDICTEHGISSGTLRDRVRRWRWARRRLPIPFERPPPLPATPFDRATLNAPPPSETFAAPPPPSGADASAPGEPDDRPIVVRLQSAVDRVLPAIEMTVARLGAQGMPPREMERAARALGVLTRSLRELNGLLSERRADAGHARDDDDMPEDIDAYRIELARRIDAFVASRTGKPAPPPSEAPAIAPSPLVGEGSADVPACSDG